MNIQNSKQKNKVMRDSLLQVLYEETIFNINIFVFCSIEINVLYFQNCEGDKPNKYRKFSN